MSVVTSGLGGNPITSGLGGSGAVITSGTVSLSLRQDVFVTSEKLPIVGPYNDIADMPWKSDHPYKGFKFDINRWVDLEDKKTFLPGTVGNISHQLHNGTKEAHWHSGVGEKTEDCSVSELVRFWKDDERKKSWLPRIDEGYYYSHHQPYFLFGDKHVMHSLYVGFVSGFDVTTDKITLEFEPSTSSPIIAGIYRREDNLSAFPYRIAELVSEFTGTLTSSGRESTLTSDGLPDYTKVDSFHKYELFYDQENKNLYFNQNFAFTVGRTDASYLAQFTNGPELLLEKLGTSSGGSLQKYFTKYFPVSPNDTLSGSQANHLVYVDDTLWLQATSNDLTNHGPSDKVYSIDFDLGTLTFGSAMYEDKIALGLTISDTDTMINVIGDIEHWPKKGIIKTGDELVRYVGRNTTQLLQCERGHASTIAATHLQGVSITWQRSGAVPTSSEAIYMGYSTTPRIEYGLADEPTTLLGKDVDLRPVSNPDPRGIVYISRIPSSIVSLTLETDKKQVFGNTYGPLYIGADYALLTATAYDGNGDIVSQIETTIDETIYPFVGLLNGAQNAFTSFTNAQGQVTASYSLGANLDLLGTFVTDITIGSGDTRILTIQGEYPDLEPEDVYIYAVTKDDPSRGTVGVLLDIDTATYTTAVSLGLAKSSIEATFLHDTTVDPDKVYSDRSLDGATVTIYGKDGDRESATLLYWVGKTLYLDRNIGMTLSNIDFVSVLRTDWTEWSASGLNGKKRVLYIYDTTSINPVTSELGAYRPIYPTTITVANGTTTLTYDYALATPNKSDVETNLGAYWVSTPRSIPFQASAVDPLSGGTVLSNTIQLQADLPDYLKGVYLGTSGKVPYGWRLGDDSLVAASGLDGATFVTINPVAGSSGTAIANPFASKLHLLTIS